MILLNGLGGVALSQQHAINSAKLMNAVQPDYLSTLLVTLPIGTERLDVEFGGQFQLSAPLDLFQEIQILLSHKLWQGLFLND